MLSEWNPCLNEDMMCDGGGLFQQHGDLAHS